MIKIDNEFYIDGDNYQFIVCRKAFNKAKKEEYFNSLAYCSSVENCIKYIMNYKQRKLCESDMDFDEFISKCHAINDEMQVILSKIRSCEVIEDD